MQKGVYECIFCDAQVVAPWCSCRISKETWIVICPKGHALKFFCPSSPCAKCNVNNDVTLVEGEWRLQGKKSSQIYIFPGRLNSLDFYDFVRHHWRSVYFIDVIYHTYLKHELLESYELFETTKAMQIKAAKFTWFLIAKKIGRHLINKDVTLLIAHMLDKEPFIPACPPRTSRKTIKNF